ncbi:hypothetical protein Chor_004754, partial [Crotalus horridus]
WLANVLHELLLLLLELEPLGRWGTGQLLHGAALTCWAVMIILNPLSGALLMLAFSSWKSRWCTRKREPTWRPSVEIPESGPLLGPAPESALGCRIEPGPLEVSSLLVSFGSSTSLGESNGLRLCSGPCRCRRAGQREKEGRARDKWQRDPASLGSFPRNRAAPLIPLAQIPHAAPPFPPSRLPL